MKKEQESRRESRDKLVVGDGEGEGEDKGPCCLRNLPLFQRRQRRVSSKQINIASYHGEEKERPRGVTRQARAERVGVAGDYKPSLEGDLVTEDF